MSFRRRGKNELAGKQEVLVGLATEVVTVMTKQNSIPSKNT
jgi:hypothetical protein